MSGGNRGERTAGGSSATLLVPDRAVYRPRSERRQRERQKEFALLGTTLHSMDVSEATGWLMREVASGRRDAMPVVHANAHNLHLLRNRPELLHKLASSRGPTARSSMRKFSSAGFPIGNFDSANTSSGVITPSVQRARKKIPRDPSRTTPAV